MVVVFPNREVFEQLEMPLPSGVTLQPIVEAIENGRLASSYCFTEEDIIVLTSLEGVYMREGLPEDWHYPVLDL